MVAGGSKSVYSEIILIKKGYIEPADLLHNDNTDGNRHFGAKVAVLQQERRGVVGD
jgi:hypothetical protein